MRTKDKFLLQTDGQLIFKKYIYDLYNKDDLEKWSSYRGDVATILQEWNLILQRWKSMLMRDDKHGKLWLIRISTIYKGYDWTIQEYKLKMKE